jgi:prepilin-type N-terminal cleavage/methylation domain-containing protein
MTLRRTLRSAFSLIEVLIAVAIMADLLLIGMPAYQRARKQAQNARFTADLRVAASAFEMYSAENSRYPDETAAGVLPAGMEQYLRGISWSMVNSLGGVWDWDYDQGYAKAAVCTETPIDMDDLQIADIDERIDNGVLATGSFRERTAHRRWAYIIE